MNNNPKWTDVAKAIGVWFIGILLLLKILATEGIVISNLGSDVWVSISAAVIALCALGVSIQQIRLSERHNRLSVQPKLRIEYIRAEGGRIGVSLTNTGLGPAIINRLLIKRQGQVYECNTPSFINFLPVERTRNDDGQIVSTNVEKRLNYHCIGGGASLPAGDKIWILYNDCPDSLLLNYWKFALMGVSIDAEYESMYGQCFSHNLCNVTSL
ncbi:hypothetical protein L1D40_07365 [Shewanella insulae]|uniref:hypothetical protein n=1 Tax=Shewanella insulae TaxID=2681496 RepID=UPI001EFD671C|nr:hypothetical protein [Shewanella insulae]MCG9755039.1 hypothetical protein [Shewanella insulae]